MPSFRLRPTSAILVAFATLLVFPIGAREVEARMPPITLPIEVLGDDGHSERVIVQIDDPAGVDRLYLQIHRPAYDDASVNPTRGAKGSVRVNGGAWIDLHDGTPGLEVAAAEAAYGGIAGAFRTVRFTLPISGVVAGENTLEFRFNGTDGITSGYRVLDLDLRSGARSALAPDALALDDPAAWRAPRDDPTAVAAGRDLWRQRDALRESPLGERTLRSSCADCHAAGGRDLAYFNYSDWSIVARSRFHGLSEAQGRRIASYIRSLDVPRIDGARPWNPPYQPGPGLDDGAVEAWAAGAGLTWVLENDEEMLEHLFPAGTSQAAVDDALSIRSTLNMRELPIPLQLPDWNDWLPDVHPLDIWGDAFARSGATLAYNEAVDALAEGADARVADGSVVELVEALLHDSWSVAFPPMRGPEPCKNYEAERGTLPHSLMDDLPAGLTCEDGLLSLNHWLAVKNWELFHTYDLEDVTPELYPYGETRGWFGRWRNVFEMAPHRSADNSRHFRHRTWELGAYENNAWYHLQLILNAGNRDPHVWHPQDWFYTGNWLAINARDNDVNLSLLFTATHAKMLQNLDTTGPDGLGVDKGPDQRGWWIAFVHPWRLDGRLYRSDGEPLAGLEDHRSGLRVAVANALLRQWLDKTLDYDVMDLPREEDPAAPGGGRYEHADYVVPTDLPFDAHCFYSCPGTGYVARDLWRAMHQFRAMGVDADLRGEILDWAAAVWPHPDNDWDALR